MIQVQLFQLDISPARSAAARFVDEVRRKLVEALGESDGVTQSDIARAIGVNRSIVHRQLRGSKDISLSRVAEIASVLGYHPHFDLEREDQEAGCNIAISAPAKAISLGSLGANKYTFTDHKSVGACAPSLIRIDS